MMISTKRHSTIDAKVASLSAMVLILATGGVEAQTVDTSDWSCEFCPFESGHRGDYEVGAGTVSEDSAYLGDATGHDEEGAYALVSGNGSLVSDEHRIRWVLEDLGLDSRYLALDGSRPGTFDYAVSYRELPRRQFNTTWSVFQPSGGSLSLPSDWVPAGTSGGFSRLGRSLTRQNIESDRKTLSVGGRYRPTSRWTISADYRRQDRDGNRILGGSYFTNSALLPAAFDHTTDEVDIGLRFAGERSVLSLGWYLSDFSNNLSSTNWQHPFTTVAGGESSALAEAPDSRFQQLMLSGAHVFDALNAHASFSIAVGTIEQDTAFLPYTTNDNLSSAPLPRGNFGGDVDTTRYSLAVTARPFERTRVRLRYRYDERDNRTARDNWNRVVADSFVSGDIESNVPYSYERGTLDLSAKYRLRDNLTISAGYERKDKDYDFQEVAEQSEDTGWGRVRWQAADALQVELRGGASKRDIDRYNEVFAVSLGQNPLLRKYNLAYRYREFGELSLSYAPSQSSFAASFRALYADDSYTQSRVGLTAGDDLRLGADVSWTLSERAMVYLNVGAEDISSEQFGSAAFGNRDWFATVDDSFVSIGSGFLVRQIADKVDLQADYTRTHGNSEIGIDSVASSDSFPDLESRFDQLRIRLNYRRSDRFELSLGLRYQRFSSEDWALEGVSPAAIPNVLSLGANPYSPENTIISIGFRYRVSPPATQS